MEQIKRIPSLDEFLSKEKQGSSVIEEGVDSRYISIIIKNIKMDLDAVQDFFDAGKDDKVEEYLDACVKRIKELKNKL